MKKIKIPCEIWSRAVGYFRPTSEWNPGKKSEFKDRKMISIKKVHDKIKGNNDEKK